MLVNVLLILINSLCVLYKSKTKPAIKLDRNEYEIESSANLQTFFWNHEKLDKHLPMICVKVTYLNFVERYWFTRTTIFNSTLNSTSHKDIETSFDGVSLSAIFCGRYQIQLKGSSSSNHNNNNNNNKTKITTYIYTHIVFQIIFKLKIIMCNCQIS